MIEPVEKDVFIDGMEKSRKGPQFSAKTVDKFFDWMYSDVDGKVQVCAFPIPTENSDRQGFGDSKWEHTQNLNTFKDFCETHSGLWRYQVYSGVNALDKKPEYGRGSVEHINRVSILPFDIETESESYGGATKEEVWWSYKYSLAQIRFMIEEYEVLPLVVMSENGIHLHFSADFKNSGDMLRGKQHIYSKYITLRAMNCEYVDEVKKSSPKHISFSQDDVSDPPRVMKVPGTRGIKSDGGRLCSIIHMPDLDERGEITSRDISKSKEEIIEFIEQHSSSTSSESSNANSVDTDTSDLDSNLKSKIVRYAKNDNTFKRYWEGDISEYKSRSEAEFAFILKMLNHGFSEQEVVTVMWASGMSKWGEETDHYRERTIQKALDYFDGTVIKDSSDGTFTFS